MRKNGIILWACFFALLCAACQRGTLTGAKSEYYSYSSEIRVSDPITIRLSDSLSLKGLEDKVARAVTLSPQVPCRVEVMGDRILTLRPESLLEFLTTYKVTLDLGALFPDKGIKSSSFEVHTLAPIFTYTNDPLALHPQKDNVYLIKGKIETSDYVENKVIEKGLTLSGGTFPVAWTHTEDGCEHVYTVSDVPAQEAAYAVRVALAYPKLDARGGMEVAYPIPVKDQFAVVSEQVFLNPYHIDLAFSARVGKKQAFEELVSVPGGGKLRFMVSDNVLSIYPARESKESQRVTLHKGLSSDKGRELGTEWDKTLMLPMAKPFVKFISQGSLLPSASHTRLHFQALNYAKVQVRVSKVYTNNILQFFQESNYDSKFSYSYNNVARVVADTTFALDTPGSEKLRQIANYGIDLSSLIQVDKGALYRVQLRGRDQLVGEPGYESDFYFGPYNDFEERTCLVLSTNLGVTVKGASSSGEYTFFVHDLLSAQSISGAKVAVYNDVNQIIGEAVTNSSGVASLTLTDQAFTAIVSHGEDHTYLPLRYGNALSLSNFDVDGMRVEQGQKGFIFGERGVWRPGDDIHLTFLAFLAEGGLPENHPVTAVLYNSFNQQVQSLTSTNGPNGMYTFTFPTDAAAPTGNYRVQITAGDHTYYKTLKIETIKPNKLLSTIELKDEEPVPASYFAGTVGVKWLAGLPGQNLPVRVSADFTRLPTTFEGYKDYVFEDKASTFTTSSFDMLEGTTNADGLLNFAVDFGSCGKAPGFVKGLLTTQAFEPGGDFSLSYTSVKVSPYEAYVGVHVPETENSWGSLYLERSKEHTIKIVTVDALGERLTVPQVKVEVYQMGWNWWWGASSSYLASFYRDSRNALFKEATVTLRGGTGAFAIDFSKEKAGYYFIRVTDPQGGHVASKVFLVNDFDGGEEMSDRSGAARLMIKAEKDTYSVGDKAKITFPSAPGATAVITVEKSDRVLKHFTVACKGTKETVSIDLDPSMTPNVYVSVSLLQPHSTTLNDAPIRLFGVQRINVEDPKTHLYPKISVKDEVRPETDMEVTVKERDGRPMSYILAVVDEGLLSLTNYKTPNPWDAFYATEALGVSTWDLYNNVIGAFGAKMERLLAIGGDGENDEAAYPANDIERFKPVSLFYGPFTSNGKSVTYKVPIPAYFGSVRVMVVATNGTAQGCEQKNVTVTRPVMVQTTLPRIVGVEETLNVPVTVFAMKPDIGSIQVTLETNEAFTLEGPATQTVEMERRGEEVVYFTLKSAAQNTVGRVTATVKGGGETSKETIDIAVRNPNPPVNHSKTVLLAPGKELKLDYALAGKPGTNTARIEASVLPPIDLDYRLNYVLDYDHGCLEQTISSVFPLLTINSLTTLDRETEAAYQARVQRALDKIPQFALAGGGMGFWPGNGSTYVHFWSTIYAVHFMYEASQKGYAIPTKTYQAAVKYIKERALRDDDNTPLERAYAYMTLALSGDAPRSGMNRLRTDPNLNSSSQWFLALAYCLDGKKQMAQELVNGLYTGKQEEYYGCYDSEERRLATAIMLYNALGNSEQAFKAVETLAKRLNSRETWLSTQSTSWALHAVAQYVQQQASGEINLSAQVGKQTYAFTGKDSYQQADLKDALGAQTATLPVTLKNNGTAQTYVVVSSRGIPAQGKEKSASSGLSVKVSYTTTKGAYLNPFSLERGTEFLVHVDVTNTSKTQDYSDLVLSHVFPSGWEFARERSNSFYQDFRDDRIYTYFDLSRGSTLHFTVKATATYAGRSYLPATTCEAMYNASIYGTVQGAWCEVK